MERKRKLIVGKIAVVLAVVPILLWAYEYGPNPGYCGVPNENGGATCANSGCHTGTANNPANKGSVTVTFPDGTNYVPGVKQHITVTIADPAPSQVAWGFQLTARLASNTATMAGSFTPTDVNTQIMCSHTNLQSSTVRTACPVQARAAASLPVRPPAPPVIPCSTSSTAIRASSRRRAHGSGTYQFDWTPPATNVGNITIYVAGNAGVAGAARHNRSHLFHHLHPDVPFRRRAHHHRCLQRSRRPDRRLPQRSVTIYGTEFRACRLTDDWTSSIVNGNLPATLDGRQSDHRRTGGLRQLHKRHADQRVGAECRPGRLQVTVTTSAEPALPSPSIPSRTARPSSTGRTVSRSPPMPTTPGPSRTGPSPALPPCPAKPGEAIILWGTGFGPTKPAAPSGVADPQSDQSDLLHGHSRYRHHRGNASFGVCARCWRRASPANTR